MTDDDRDRELLRYIAESISLIERYTISGKAAFLDELMLQDAVLRRLETLADATRHLSNAVTARHPEIHWRQIYGFRNVAAHGYLALRADRIWDTVQDYLPILKSVVDDELHRLDTS